MTAILVVLGIAGVLLACGILSVLIAFIIGMLAGMYELPWIFSLLRRHRGRGPGPG